MEALIPNELVVLAEWRKATTAPKGRPVTKNGDVITIKPKRGTDRAYLLDRLKREARSI